MTIPTKAARTEEELLVSSNGDGSSLLELKSFMITIINNFVFIIFIKIKFDVSFDLSSIWIGNWTSLKGDTVVAGASVVQAFHQIQVKRLSRKWPEENTENED